MKETSLRILMLYDTELGNELMRGAEIAAHYKSTAWLRKWYVIIRLLWKHVCLGK